MHISATHIEKNSIHEVLIDGWSSDGSGVAHIDGHAVFIPNTIKGERWIIKIVKVSKTAIYGKPLEIIKASDARIVPQCPIFGKCGGCQLSHMTYEKELDFKLDTVNSALHHIGGLDYKVSHIIPSEKRYGYRNKSIIAVGKNDKIIFGGFYQKRSHHIIPVKQCFLQTAESNQVINSIIHWMNQEKIEPYDESRHKGSVRHIFTRQSEHCSDFVVCIISARGFGNKTHALVDILRQECPYITGIVLNINKTKGNTILAGDFYTLWGDPCIKDSLNGIYYQIAPQAFFQVNPLQAENLYSKVSQLTGLKGNEIVLDLYCGTGTITLYLAQFAKRAIGIEIIEEAIVNAKENAHYNGINNAEFYCTDASNFNVFLNREKIQPNIIIIDPPRKGLTEAIIDDICEINPEMLIYVSCNPATLARDLKHFDSKGFIMKDVCLVDMFPNTSHVETVVLMTRTE